MKSQTQYKFVSRESIVAEVVAKYPDVAPILLSYGLHCVGCHVSAVDTIEAGCATHGMGDEEIESLLKDVNEFIEQNGLAEEKQNKKEDMEIKEIELSENAVAKFKELMKKENKEGFGLKIEVVSGGCSGFVYELDFAKEGANDDLVLEKGIKVFMAKKTAEMMSGARIDFVDGLNGSGFKIENPSAKASCGCGKSFR